MCEGKKSRRWCSAFCGKELEQSSQSITWATSKDEDYLLVSWVDLRSREELLYSLGDNQCSNFTGWRWEKNGVILMYYRRGNAQQPGRPRKRGLRQDNRNSTNTVNCQGNWKEEKENWERWAAQPSSWWCWVTARQSGVNKGFEGSLAMWGREKFEISAHPMHYLLCYLYLLKGVAEIVLNKCGTM